MGVFKVYMKTFDYDGSYESEFVDISRDVLKMTDPKETLDSTEYDLGIFKFNKIKITLRNDHGRFTPPPNYRSIFKSKMKDSRIRVTWNIRPEPLCVGVNFPPSGFGPLGEEIEIYTGLLTELTNKGDIENQSVSFDVISENSLLTQVTVPFADIDNGDPISDVIYDTLNQSVITDVLDVFVSNINPGLDQAIDDKSDLENKTGKQAFGKGNSLLFLSQSVMRIENNEVIVSDREPTADIKHNFYGPGSTLGNENIIDIKDYRQGLNSLFNFWTWQDTSLLAQSTSSIDTYGVSAKEVKGSIITDTTKRQNILNSLRDDFSEPKKEMILIAPLTVETAVLKLLDRVNIDYPAIYRPADDGVLPVWGAETWGSFKWPIGSFEFEITQQTEFKILARKIRAKDETIEFKLREV